MCHFSSSSSSPTDLQPVRCSPHRPILLRSSAVPAEQGNECPDSSLLSPVPYQRSISIGHLHRPLLPVRSWKFGTAQRGLLLHKQHSTAQHSTVHTHSYLLVGCCNSVCAVGGGTLGAQSEARTVAR